MQEIQKHNYLVKAKIYIHSLTVRQGHTKQVPNSRVCLSKMAWTLDTEWIFGDKLEAACTSHKGNDRSISVYQVPVPGIW